MAAKKLSKILADLRSRAEQRLRDKGAQLPDTDKLDLMRLAHEIEVQYVELEIQNEELQHAVKDLEASRNAFAELYQSAPIGFVALDRNGLILQANVAAMQMLPNSKDLTGTPFLLQIHPEDHLIFQAHMRDKASGKKDGPIDVRLVESSKQIVYAQVHVNTGHNAINGDLFYRLALVNVTERTQAEQTLRVNQERFRALVEATSQALYRMSPDWSEMRQLQGGGFLADTERPNRNWLEQYIHPDDQPKVMAAINTAIQIKRTFVFEHRVRRADGTLGWTFSRAVPLLDENGDIVEWFGAASDFTARKRMEEELRYAKEQLEYHMDNSPLAIIEFDPTYKVIRWSGTAEQMFGWKADEILGKSISEIDWVHDDDKALVAKVSSDMLSGGRPRNLNINRNYRKDGSIIQCEWYNSALYDNQGQLASVLSQVLDVTEKRKTEQDLLESEKRFHRLFEDDLTGDFVCTAEGEILLCNQAFADIFGYPSPDKAVGTYMTAFLIHTDLTERKSMLDALKRHGKIERLGAWRKRRDGKSIYIVENLVGHFNEEGELYEIQGYVFDDTDRKLTERALQGSEQRFRLALRNSPVSVTAQDLNLKYIWAYNQKTAPPEGIIGKRDEEIFTPEEAAYVTKMKQRVLEENIELREQMWFNRPSGKIYLDVCWEPIRNQAGKITGVASATVDLTPIKKAEEELRRLNETLERRVAERTALSETRARQLQVLAVELIEAEERERRRVAGLLHDDLQQILASARMQLGARNLSSDPMLSNVERLLSEAIDKSRHLSHELSPAVLHHSGLVEGLNWLTKHMEAAFGLKVQLEVNGIGNVDNANLKLFLFRASQELLFNIVKHSGVKEAMLELAKTNGFFVLTVSDRGKGLNPQILDTASPPSGLGLLSLRERARYIGGSFVIESTPNLGSRFTLTVPASISGKDEGPRPTIEYRTDQLAEASHTVGAVGTRVLFVDDHQIMRQGLINLTGTQPGIHVAGEASNGHEAIEKARNLKPNVIVMDISMPEMDGIEATRRIKAEWPNVRVIGLTMHDDFQQTDAMQQAGAEMVLSKTTSADELVRAIYGKQ